MWPAIIMSIGSMLAQGLNWILGNKSAEKQNEYNTQAQNAQNEWNLQQWNRENDYNSFGAQMQRAQDAGVNPYFALGNSPQASPLQSADRAPSAGVTPNIGNFLGEGVQTYQQAQLQDANIKKIEAETKQIEANTQGLKLNNEYNSQTLGERIALLQNQNAREAAIAEQEKINAQYARQLKEQAISRGAQELLTNAMQYAKEFPFSSPTEYRLFLEDVINGRLPSSDMQVIVDWCSMNETQKQKLEKELDALVAQIDNYRKQGKLIDAQTSNTEKQGELLDSEAILKQLDIDNYFLNHENGLTKMALALLTLNGYKVDGEGNISQKDNSVSFTTPIEEMSWDESTNALIAVDQNLKKLRSPDWKTAANPFKAWDYMLSRKDRIKELEALRSRIIQRRKHN